MVQKTPAPPPSNPPPKKRGRPRAYDPDLALRRARAAFWKAGYAATSLDAIADATGMNRPSLYAAFGDKRALYLKALGEYWAEAYPLMAAALSPERPLYDGLMQVYKAALDIYFAERKGALGCFGIGTAVSEAVEEAPIRVLLLEGLERLDRYFIERFRLARAEGEIAPSADPEALGRLASATLHTLAIRSRAGAKRRDLEKLAQGAARAICGT